MKKTGIMKKLIAVFLIAILGVAALPATSYAKEPTIMTKSKALTIGKNQLTYNNYYTSEDTLLGCFTAPEAGKYQFYITNNGEAYSSFHILDEDLAEIEASGYFNTIHPTEYVLFKIYNLKKGEKIYFYIEGDSSYYDDKLLAAKVDIQLVSPAKPAPKMSKSVLSLKVNKKTTLKLKNNKKRVIWVSSNKKVATVSSKGVVKAKKKGTAYIYAIAGHKLYKCKVKTY